MANPETILAGISGALKGGLDMYSWQKEREDRNTDRTEQNRVRSEEVERKKKSDAATETERQRQIAAQQEIIDSLPDTNPDGSPNTLKTALRVQYAQPKGNTGNAMIRDTGATSRNTATNASRETVANINQEGANARHATASGSVIENNRGAMERLGKNISFGEHKLTVDSSDRRRGQDVTARGQDISAATGRRGQDISAETGRRGQDKAFELGTQRDATTRRGQDKKKGMYDDIFKTPGAPTGVTGEDTNLPVEPTAPVKAPIPVTPRAGGGAAPAPAISDADLDTLATSILSGQGVPATPENVKMFKERNRDRLIQKIQTVRQGGG